MKFYSQRCKVASSPLPLLALCAGTVCASGAQAQVGTLVALPDTQFYSDSAIRFPQFLQQTNWVKDNRSAMRIDFVSHLGDIVQNGGVLAEWQRADQAMDVLDTISPTLPYAAVAGNHDFATTGSKGTLLQNYLANFGPQRYAGQSWYGGSTSNGWNSYQIVNIGGRQYLHLALEWLPASVTAGQDDAIAWAQSIIDANFNMPTILSTHEYIIDDFTVASGRSAGGEAIWSSLVRNNNQIFLCLNGHFHRGVDGDDGERFEVATNNFGRPVLQFLSDFQAYPNGGDAYLRLYALNEPANMLHVVTMTPKDNASNTAGLGISRFFAASPSTPYPMPAGLPALTSGTVQVDANSRIEVPLDFATRFAPVPPPPPPPPPAFRTVNFREGVAGYAGTQDNYVATSTATTAFGGATIVKVDNVDGAANGPVHGLLRFENIIGAGTGQIAAAASIDLATLTVTTSNATANAVNIHRMVGAWDETSTWSSLVNGVQADGVEAGTAIEATLPSIATGVRVIDVTPSVSSWVSGEVNQGWALLPTGSDGWDFASSEATTVGSRPQLTVRVLNPGVQRAIFQNGVAGYAGTLDAELLQATPTVNRGAAADFSIDGDDPNGTGNDNHVLIQFQDIIGSGPGQIPAGSQVVINLAQLVVEGFDPGDGASVHRMLQPWDENVTWAASFGGNGIQTTGIEAVALQDSLVAGATGRVEINVTSSVQAWVLDPTLNFGWALLPVGNNGWDIRSSESSPAPQLRVYYTVLPPAGCDSIDFNGDRLFPDDADLIEFLNVLAGQACSTGTCGDIDFNNDGLFPDDADLLDFLTVLAGQPCD
jgi:hypothetical protein